MEMAERTLDTMIETILSDPEKMKSGILRIVFPERVDVLHQIFMGSQPGSPNKNDSITKLETLIRKLKPTNIIGRIHLAQAMITLAKMCRNSGGEKLESAKDQANQAFDICIADLEDSFQWNDAAALRVLAQILMYAGLEYDAKISISLMLSKIDQYETIYDSDDSVVFSLDTPARIHARFWMNQRTRIRMH
ncbi:hypothetical protein OCU04_001188 [Sclerotinia nivalis]|uniref:Uncharacterized protein n=1 Tax=Sclerotinia nivalis TaxID=352851 RepID=A0A9X0AXL1_9HELO|nr:hypothetical protein OCU04_001188 [Sclerotinia nivalis]